MKYFGITFFLSIISLYGCSDDGSPVITNPGPQEKHIQYVDTFMFDVPSLTFDKRPHVTTEIIDTIVRYDCGDFLTDGAILNHVFQDLHTIFLVKYKATFHTGDEQINGGIIFEQAWGDTLRRYAFFVAPINSRVRCWKEENSIRAFAYEIQIDADANVTGRKPLYIFLRRYAEGQNEDETIAQWLSCWEQIHNNELFVWEAR